MKHLTKISYALLAAWGVQVQAETVVQSQNLILARSMTNADQALEFSMLAPSNFIEHEGSWAFNAAAAGVYKRYFNFVETKGLGAAPLWSGTNSMKVTLSNNQVENVKDAAVFSADQIGLGLSADNTAGQFSLDPIYYQAGGTIMLEAAYERWFAQARFSAGKTVIDPQLTNGEQVVVGELPYRAGQFTADAIASPFKSLQEAFKGNKAIGIYTGLTKGRIDGVATTGFTAGDINLSAGYKLIANEDSSLQVALRGVIPCGNKPTGDLMLEPIFGNGGYYQLGGQLTGHFKVWESAHQNNNVHINFDVFAMHSFENSKGLRSFDLKNNGKGSKYLLVADFNAANNETNNSVQNLINVSTLQVKSSFDAEVNGMLAIGYEHKGFSFNIGYDVWVRTKETLAITGVFDALRWAVVGQQNVQDSSNILCQPGATMGNLAPYADGNISGALGDVTAVLQAATPANRVSGVDALDVAGATQALAATSSVFANVNYQWEWNKCTPHVGVHGSWEFSHTGNNAVPQFGVALILGSSF